MFLFRNATTLSVSKYGAVAGCVLRGSAQNNRGLRVKVLREQKRGNEGAIKGDFVILDAGDNMHSDPLGRLVDQVVDAEAVVGIIRQLHHGCVNVVNANILVPE